MKFDLEKAELLFEVRHEKDEEIYTYEQLYKSLNGEFFIHFKGSAYSSYGVKTGYCRYSPREGNYSIDDISIKVWKSVSRSLECTYPKEYLVIDWEEECKKNLLWMEKIAEEELPF